MSTTTAIQRVFFKTEFTTPEHPELLSVGLVAEDDLECYIELDLESALGQRRIAVANPFALKTVLSQWSRNLISGEVTQHIGFAAAGWLHRLAEHLEADLELVYADRVDADLLKAALKSAGTRWSRIEPRVRWAIVSYMNDDASVAAAMNYSWATSLEGEGIARHHALADARALAAGFKAIHGVESR